MKANSQKQRCLALRYVLCFFTIAQNPDCDFFYDVI